jgi:putative redox protein
MVQIDVSYQGDLRCIAKHGPSGATLTTDAPVDNMGKGQAFSPTDLVATALGTCMLTIMGIVAQRHGIDISGATVSVTREMAAQPVRRIGRLAVTINVPNKLSEEDRRRLEHGAMTCPVHKSMHPDVEMPVKFNWAV